MSQINRTVAKLGKPAIFTLIIMYGVFSAWFFFEGGFLYENLDDDRGFSYAKDLMSSGSSDDFSVLYGVFVSAIMAFFFIVRIGKKYSLLDFLFCFSLSFFQFLMVVNLDQGSLIYTAISKHDILIKAWIFSLFFLNLISFIFYRKSSSISN